MKKILIGLLLFNVIYSKDYTNEKNKEVRKFFITFKDFKNFEYDISNCNLNTQNKYELNVNDGNGKLIFSFDKNKNPDGLWESITKVGNEDVVFKEECYKNGEVIKSYNFSYNTATKKRTLDNGFIYDPFKKMEYYVTYSFGNQSVDGIFFKMNNKIYSFSQNKNKELVIINPTFSQGYPDYISLYDFYIEEIEKIGL